MSIPPSSPPFPGFPPLQSTFQALLFFYVCNSHPWRLYLLFLRRRQQEFWKCSSLEIPFGGGHSSLQCIKNTNSRINFSAKDEGCWIDFLRWRREKKPCPNFFFLFLVPHLASIQQQTSSSMRQRKEGGGALLRAWANNYETNGFKLSSFFWQLSE